MSTIPYFRYSAVQIWHIQFLPKSSQNTPHSSPVRVRYGVSFVGSISTSVTAVMCSISCYIGPHYNGTRLYYIFTVCSLLNIFELSNYQIFITKFLHLVWLSSDTIWGNQFVGYPTAGLKQGRCHHPKSYWLVEEGHHQYIDGILPKGPYPPCLRMADRALLAGYPRYMPDWFILPLTFWAKCYLWSKNDKLISTFCRFAQDYRIHINLLQIAEHNLDLKQKLQKIFLTWWECMQLCIQAIVSYLIDDLRNSLFGSYLKPIGDLIKYILLNFVNCWKICKCMIWWDSTRKT